MRKCNKSAVNAVDEYKRDSKRINNIKIFVFALKTQNARREREREREASTLKPSVFFLN